MGTACPLSGRNSTYRSVQISETSSYIYAQHDEAIAIYAKIWQQDAKDVATYFPKYFGYKGEWSLGGFDKEALGKMSDGLH